MDAAFLTSWYSQIVNDCDKNPQLVPKDFAQYLTERMWMNVDERILIFYIISSGKSFLEFLYSMHFFPVM